MATTPHYGWETPDDTDLVKDGALAIRTLGNAIDSTVYSNVGGMTLISTTTLSGTTIALTSIPQTYKDLKVVIRNLRPATDNTNLRLRFNEDATANRHADAATNGTTTFNVNDALVINNVDNGTSSSLIHLEIFDYTNTSTWKMLRTFAIANDATTATSMRFYTGVGAYNQTSAVSSFSLAMSSGNFTSGTVLLYGVK